VTGASVRTVERGYASSTGRRAGQVSRVHVIRDTPPRTERGLEAGHQTWCGQTTGKHQDSAAIVRDAPHALWAFQQLPGERIGRRSEPMPSPVPVPGWQGSLFDVDGAA